MLTYMVRTYFYNHLLRSVSCCALYIPILQFFTFMGLAHYNDFNFERCNDPFTPKSIRKKRCLTTPLLRLSKKYFLQSQSISFFLRKYEILLIYTRKTTLTVFFHTIFPSEIFYSKGLSTSRKGMHCACPFSLQNKIAGNLFCIVLIWK